MTEQTAEETTDRAPFVAVVARNIRVLAAAEGITITALGEQINLRHPALSKRMAGDVQWTLTDLLAVARYFRVPLSIITPDTLTEDVTE